MFFLPPRSTKSVICSKLFPAWYIGRKPNHEILTVSHSDQLSSDFGRTVRDIVDTELFHGMFPGVTLKRDVRAAGKWMTNQNGQYYAAGIRSKVAGRGAHVALLDDVMSETEAFSPAGRKFAQEWYPAGIRTRIMPGGSIVIINTRYHWEDICGWLLAMQEEFDTPTKERWKVISIPAWLDEKSAKLLNLEEGHSYFPEWKSDEELRLVEREIKGSNGTKYWESLYMQNPTPEKGSAIKTEWFQWWEYDEPPGCDFILQSLDTAFSTKQSADFSVIQTWGIFNLFDEDADTGDEFIVPNLILLGSVKERLEYPDLRRIAKEEYLRYRPDFCVVEKKASGQSLIQDLRRSGLPVLEYSPDRDKLSRVHTASPMLESGKVWLPKGKDWARDLFDEAIMFPYGAHDDQVDAMTMAIHYVKDSWRLEHPDDPDWEDEPRRHKRVGYWKV